MDYNRMRGVISSLCMTAAVDRSVDRKQAIWNNGLSTRVSDWVTRRPVCSGKHNSLSINLKLVKAQSHW